MNRRSGKSVRATLYDARVGAGLTAAMWRARHLRWWPDDVSRRFDADTDRLVVLSDMHRGKRDRADDFQPCEEAYLRALDTYLEEGYTLAMLGDVEPSELKQVRMVDSPGY